MHTKRWVTAFEPTALLAERVQNISIYTVYIDMFCTRSAKSAVGSKAVTRNAQFRTGRYDSALRHWVRPKAEHGSSPF